MNHFLSVPEIKKTLIEHLEQEQNGWKGETKNHIVRVIQGYGKRDGLFDYVSGLVYRIWNAIKSIFHQSDWQLAKKSVIRESKNRTNLDMDLMKLEALERDLKTYYKVEKLEKDLNEKNSEALLQAYVQPTYAQVSSPEEVIRKHTDLLIQETENTTPSGDSFDFSL